MNARSGARRWGIWPPLSDHIYLKLFADTVQSAGFDLAYDGGPTTDAAMRAAVPLNFLSLHWPEHLWARAGHYAHARAIVGLWRFLRVCRRLNVPVVWTVHNLTPHEGARWWDRAGFWLMASASSIAVAHSETAARELQRRHRSLKDRIVVTGIGNFDGVYPPASGETFSRETLGIKPGDRVLLCLGLIRPYKGLDRAIDAIHRLGGDTHLVIAGPCTNPEWEQALRTRCQTVPNVTVAVRQLTNQEVADLHALADCVVLPYTAITGSAALLTAFTLGRGVIATDLPYFREMLAIDPLAGVLAEPSAQGIVDGVSAFFSVPLVVRSRAARAIADACAWPIVVRPLLERLHTLLDASAG